VERFCQNLTITSDGFANVILGAQLGRIPGYEYLSHFVELRPDDIKLTTSDLSALSSNGVGTLNKEAKKTVRKLNQAFLTRRLLSVHLFYTPSRMFWHLFYFDQRDYENPNSHWEHGPHIHYSRESFVNCPLEDVWSKVTQDKPSLPPALHIRYSDS
jgi:hypothetical protein